MSFLRVRDFGTLTYLWDTFILVHSLRSRPPPLPRAPPLSFTRPGPYSCSTPSPEEQKSAKKKNNKKEAPTLPPRAPPELLL